MNQGIVKWFELKKGYGFITAENGDEVFVHWLALEIEGFKTLEEGQAVTFEVEPNKHGLMARKVSLLLN